MKRRAAFIELARLVSVAAALALELVVIGWLCRSLDDVQAALARAGVPIAASLGKR
jgi:hypothetical protein